MPIDVSRLQVELEEGERWQRTLNITIPAEIVTEERRAAIRKLRSRIKLPGFRDGKVPVSVVERRFGPALDQELLDRVIGEAYRGVLKDQALRPISEGQVGEVEYKRDEDMSFQITFDVAPDPDLERLSGFQVERPRIAVGDEDVDKVLERLQDQQGRWVEVPEGQPGQGDQVTVRIQRLGDAGEEEAEAPAAEEEAAVEAEGTAAADDDAAADAQPDAGAEVSKEGPQVQEPPVDTEPRRYEFVLGDGEALPDVETAIRSLSVGESGEFTVTFPQDFPNEERRGKSDRLRIFLDARQERDRPPVDDEFASKVGDFSSLEELKGRIREDLEKEAEQEMEAAVRGRLLEQVIAANPFPVPQSMVDQYIRSAAGDEKNELGEEEMVQLREQFGPRAEAAVQRFIAIDRIAAIRELEATEDDLDERIEEMAEKTGSNPGEIYARLQKSGQLERLQREITERKVFDFLKSESTITDAG